MHSMSNRVIYNIYLRVDGYKSYATISKKTVRIGDDCIAQPGSFGFTKCQSKHLQTRQIRAVVIDKRFGDRLCIDGHDWAIIEVDKPMNFTENIVPICLPDNTTEVEPRLITVSWGRPKCMKE